MLTDCILIWLSAGRPIQLAVAISTPTSKPNPNPIIYKAGLGPASGVGYVIILAMMAMWGDRLSLRARLIKWRHWLGRFRGVWFVSLTFVAVITTHVLIARPYGVDGDSMEPTLSHGDHLIIWKAGHVHAWLADSQFVPKRGQIIVLKHPVEKTVIIKRVVGLPGEQVILHDGQIIVINADNPGGFEPNLNTSPAVLPPPENRVYPQLADDEIFVIGDNRWPGQSSDSRSFAKPAKLDDIVGDLTLRVLPLNRFDWF